MEKDIKKMTEFQNKVHALISELDISDNEDMMMASAIMLKTAVEMYTVQFDEDEHIVNLLGAAAESIPLIRGKMDYLNDNPTIH